MKIDKDVLKVINESEESLRDKIQALLNTLPANTENDYKYFRGVGTVYQDLKALLASYNIDNLKTYAFRRQIHEFNDAVERVINTISSDKYRLYTCGRTISNNMLIIGGKFKTPEGKWRGVDDFWIEPTAYDPDLGIIRYEFEARSSDLKNIDLNPSDINAAVEISMFATDDEIKEKLNELLAMPDMANTLDKWAVYYATPKA